MKTKITLLFLLFLFPFRTIAQLNLIGCFNALKSVLTTKVVNKQALINNSSGTISVELFSVTRNYSFFIQTIDISSVLVTWATEASNGDNELKTDYRTFMAEGLRNNMCNFDNVCELRVATSNPNVSIALNGLQFLYYNLL